MTFLGVLLAAAGLLAPGAAGTVPLPERAPDLFNATVRAIGVSPSVASCLPVSGSIEIRSGESAGTVFARPAGDPVRACAESAGRLPISPVTVQVVAMGRPDIDEPLTIVADLRRPGIGGSVVLLTGSIQLAAPTGVPIGECVEVARDWGSWRSPFALTAVVDFCAV
ncbi:hypothetical protein [Hamadaea tsunoensis]|uniref:hypothetical protein n=1 Tax=Hamadaea tsunoensis TaxID=53368 RepID=UPI00040CE069|nr:hypothetical protein [Hamadaea tsunoensis]